MTTLDPHGQPVNLALNRRHRTEREIDELVGICRGLAADGVLNNKEAVFLRDWLNANRDGCNQWPANVLIDRLERVLADGVVDTAEEKELYRLLLDITGGKPNRVTEASLSIRLPFDTPPPVVEIQERSFCFTGKFLLGPRSHCQSEVVTRGGVAVNSVSTKLNYLVIGIVGSRDWIHSSHGRKIQKAVEYRERGMPLAIISEKHFIDSIDPRGP